MKTVTVKMTTEELLITAHHCADLLKNDTVGPIEPQGPAAILSRWKAARPTYIRKAVAGGEWSPRNAKYSCAWNDTTAALLKKLAPMLPADFTV